MLIKSVQWLLPSYSILYPDTLLYKKFKNKEQLSHNQRKIKKTQIGETYHAKKKKNITKKKI